MLIHPLVVHFPIALWLTAALFDILGRLRPDRLLFREAAYWLIGLGVAGGLASVATGWLDLLSLEAQGVGTGLLTRHTWHSVLSYAATALFLAVFLVRWRTKNAVPAWLLVLSIAGAVAVAVTGYLGGDIRQVM